MLSFKKLNVGYKNTILENLSGEVFKNTITFLIGQNGSGKTSLLKTLSQIIPAQSGVITTEESPIYLPSEFNAQVGLTGEDLVDLFSSKNSKWHDKGLFDYFEINSLLKHTLESLSSGERQRILIAAVLSNASNLVFLDEPLNHLDWNFSLKLKKIISDQSQSGRSFLISNHDLNWALNFSTLGLNTQTWVLFKKSIFLNNSTETVLNDIKLQEVFKVKAEVQVSPNNKKTISLSEIE